MTTTQTNTRRRVTGPLITAAGIATMVIMHQAPPAAAGEPLERFSFTDVQEEIREDFCGIDGLDVHWQRIEHGVVLLSPRGPDQLPHAQGSFQGSATYTNLATGRSVEFRWNSMDKSHLVVDNGDGTSTEIVQVSGDRSWWSEGRRIAPDTGTMRVEVLVDNGGTPTDPFDDEFIDVVVVAQPSTGRNEANTFDLCGDFLALTT